MTKRCNELHYLYDRLSQSMLDWKILLIQHPVSLLAWVRQFDMELATMKAAVQTIMPQETVGMLATLKECLCSTIMGVFT